MSTPILRSHKYKYSPAGVTHIYKSLDRIQGFSASHHQAAARAVLRHGVCSSGTENETRHPVDGLHPLFFGLCNSDGSVQEPAERNQLLRDTLTDCFDAVSVFFCIEAES